MNRIVKWFASSLGYLLYTVLVLTLLLWLLFPADRARMWMQQSLNTEVPAVRWEIEKLRPVWPFALVASGVSLKEDRDEGTPIMQLDRVTLSPDFGQVAEGLEKIPLRWEIKALAGIARGTVLVARPEGRLEGRGSVEDIKLSLLEDIWTRLDRTVSGTMSGEFSLDMVWTDIMQAEMKGKLRVDDGIVSLQQPVFNLSRLEFREMTASLELADKVLLVKSGKIESKMLTGEYSGLVALQTPLAVSQIKLDGFIEPRSELFGRLQNNARLTLIKNQLQDNKLSFAVSGSVLEPGIVFQGASGVIDGIIDGSGR